MTKQRLDYFSQQISHFISARRISAALNATRQMLDEAIASWEMREQLGALREAYKYLCQYAFDGTPDPHREDVYADITGGIMDLVNQIAHGVIGDEGYSLYASTLRAERVSKVTLAAMIAEIRKLEDERRLAIEAGLGQDSLKQWRQRRAEAERALFNRVWVTCPLRPDEEAELTALMLDESVDVTTRMLIVSALLLMIMAGYDERAMYVLARVAYSAAEPRLKARALCAMLIAMSLNRSRRPGKRLSALLDTMRDEPTWTRDVEMVFLQLIRTRDTDKITRKMNEEVIPEILKLRADIDPKMIPDNPEDMINGDVNPEWEEKLERSGIADKLRDIQERQEEGDDVMMSAFSHLKTFPFFHEIANWFLPFRSDGEAIGDSLEASSMICDNDRYSILYSIDRLPAEQQEMMVNALKAQAEAIKQQSDTPEGVSGERLELEAETRAYTHDLYRFFRLFRRKGEWKDPFATSLNLAVVPALKSALSDPEQLRVIAEFYFKRGYYDDAYDLFSRLSSQAEPSVSISQKMGYCRQSRGDLQGAVKHYLNAYTLKPESPWTLRRLGSCYRLMGQLDRAAEYYRQLTELKPDDLKAALQLGHCLMEQGRIKDALQQYFKVEYLDPGSPKALHPIAWCCYLSGDYDRARDYYQRLPQEAVGADDLMNMGHVEMATANYNTALDRYTQALDKMGGDRAKFAQAMQSDLRYLRQSGVEDLMTGIVLDRLLTE